MVTRRSNEERTRTSRHRLVTAARQLFEQQGYADTSIDDIVKVAGMTKGALYHHFETKKALFDAVIVDIQDELASHVERSATKEETAREKFVAGWLSALEVAPEAGIRRLMLEAPAVLGYPRWLEIDYDHFKPDVAASLEHLHAKGLLELEPSNALAEVLLTISNALLTLIVQNEDPSTAREEVMQIWGHLLRSLMDENTD